MKTCKEEENLSFCTCTYKPCPRKGICCECLRYHWQFKELPACLFPPDIEKTYDRSLSMFISCYKKK